MKNVILMQQNIKMHIKDMLKVQIQNVFNRSTV